MEELVQLLGNAFRRVVHAREIHARLARSLSDFLRAHRRREALGHVVDGVREGDLPLLRHLVLFPHRKRRLAVLRFILTKYMGMPRDEFSANSRQHVRQIERTRFLLHNGVEHRL